MQVFQLDQTGFTTESKDASVSALKRGEIICYPTETFYALGIDLWNADALSRLYALKRRGIEKELPLIAGDFTQVELICDTADPRVRVFSDKFWPGPLTLVLPARTESRSFAIRISSHPVAREIASAFGMPIVSTSANRTGEPPIRDPQFLTKDFERAISVLLNAGRTSADQPSTIVSLLEQPGKILRQGAVSASEIVSLL